MEPEKGVCFAVSELLSFDVPCCLFDPWPPLFCFGSSTGLQVREYILLLTFGPLDNSR